MAENVQITPGSGVTIGADSVLDGTLGSAQIQFIKIMDGTIGGTNKAAVTANGLAVDGSGVTQPISAVSLPLPVGAATETTLASVNTNTANLDVLLSTRASEATLSSIDAQTSQFTFSVGRLVVDGSGVTQPISGTVTSLQGTSPWVISGSVSVSNASLAVTQSGIWSVGRTWTLASGTDSISSVQSGTWTTGRTWTLASGTDSIAAVQSGTWNINNISGTISLPTGASTAANQTTANASLSSIDGKTPPLGQAAMAASVPVVIASNQSAVPVTLTSTTITGTVAVTQSTSPWVVSGTVTANIGTSGSLALDATVAALEVAQGSTTSGQKGILELGAVTTAAPTYTTGQTSPLSLDTAGNLRVILSGSSIEIGKVDQGLQGTIAQSWFVEMTDGTNVLGTAAHPVRIDPTGTTTQPVSVTNASLSVTQGTSPWVVSGTVTANAGTGNFTVVQATGTNLHTVVDSGSITVSNATLAVTQSGVWTTGRTWTLASGTDSVAAVQSGTWNINNISGTVSLPTGAATETTLAGIKTDTDKFTFAATRLLVDGSGVTQPVSGTVTANQGTSPWVVSLASTTITGTVAVTQSTSPWVVSLASTTITGTVTTAGNLTHNNAAPAANNIGVLPAVASAANPTYTTGDQVLLSTDLSGNLRVVIDGSIAEQNVNLNQVGGAAIALGQTTMSASLPVTIASNQTALPVTLTSTTITGTVAVTQSTSPWVVSGTVTANIGTTNGLALDATLAKLTLAQGSTTSGQTGALTLGAVTTVAPTYTTAQSSPLSLTTAGALRTDSSATTQPVSGTVTANAGTGTFNIQANASTNLNQVAGSAVSTAATGIQKVGISDSAGASVTNGQKTMANSLPVVIASDQSAVPVNVAGGSVSSATVSSVSVSTTVATLLTSRAARIKAVIFNESGTLFVKAGSSASSSDYTWRMTANTELDIEGYTGIVTATKSAGTSNAQVTDF